MAKWLVALVLVAVATAAACYFWIYLPQAAALDAARREASTCLQEVAKLKGRIADLEAMLDLLEQSSSALAGEVRAKEDELASVRVAQTELMTELEQEIANGQIQVEQLRGQLTVDLIDKLLFDSGEAALNEAGTNVLTRVGSVLKKAEGREIVVHGHTDNVQIVGKLAERYPSNWELSAARAVNVVRFLQDEVGIDPEQLSAVGFAEYQPRADNSSAEGRQQNRRIEIVLAPPVVRLTGEPLTAPAPNDDAEDERVDGG